MDHRQLFFSRHRLDRQLTFQGRTLAGVSFVVDQFDRKTAACVSGGRASIVLLAAAFHVLGDSGVKRAVSAANNLDKPGVAEWLFHFGRLAVLDS